MTWHKNQRSGEIIEGFPIPVLNDRAIRASAGIFLVISLISAMRAGLLGDFKSLTIFAGVLFIEMAIRVLISPKYSPALYIGALITEDQSHEWVGAAQKRFAWILAMGLSGTLLISQLLAPGRNPISTLICMLCIFLLLAESAFGICIGCQYYSKFFPNKPTVCSNGLCSVK